MASGVNLQPTPGGLPSRILEKGPDYLRRQLELEGGARGQMSAVQILADSKGRYMKCQQEDKEAPAGLRCVTVGGDHVKEESPGQKSAIVRRGSSRRQRPDSLLIYRQKGEGRKGENSGSSNSLIKKLFVSPPKDRMTVPPQAPTRGSKRKDHVNEKQEPEHEVPCKASNLPYSHLTAEFEAFFTRCGLEQDVLDTLGSEELSQQMDLAAYPSRSASSYGELLQESLRESRVQGVSPVEKNARVIKWLYSCRKARESGRVMWELQ